MTAIAWALRLSLSVLLKVMAPETELRSITLLACIGVKASPDPSETMIQVVELKDDFSIMYLCRLGFCWFRIGDSS